ncbi:MAG TPA: hypothetical protein VFM53_05520 [Anaeromyxobacteraceae bacterium]|nr:hypothetical protein [Anaeromyxobacteraceae bacterium]
MNRNAVAAVPTGMLAGAAAPASARPLTGPAAASPEQVETRLGQTKGVLVNAGGSVDVDLEPQP